MYGVGRGGLPPSHSGRAIGSAMRRVGLVRFVCFFRLHFVCLSANGGVSFLRFGANGGR